MRAAAVTLLALALLLATGARADEAGETAKRLQQLERAASRLSAAEQGALLELFAIETRLARVERGQTSLRREQRQTEGERRQALGRLRTVEHTLSEAQRRLAARLLDLYLGTQSDDPLAVLLGAESLDEALTRIDALERLATGDRQLAESVRLTRLELRRLLRELAAERRRLERLDSVFVAGAAELRQAQRERRGYLGQLRDERGLTERRIARLLQLTETVEGVAQTVASATPEAGTAAPGTGTAGPAAPEPVVATPPAADTRERERTLTVEATGYALRGVTALGLPVRRGIVAVDPDVIPLGTRLWIPGYGEGVAADTGPAIRGATIDLWFETVAEALQWGRRTVTVTIRG